MATAVIVVINPVDPRLDCFTRRSSHCRSRSHERQNGAPVVGSVVVKAIGGEVVVSCSCYVAMGAIRKNIYHQKRFHRSSVLVTVASKHVSWKVLFTHQNVLLHEPRDQLRPQNASWELFFSVHNKRRPQLEILAALSASNRTLRWKGRNFFSTYMAD